jgi:NAD(P)-dependent dehydrogenase (short-subunit alcohol dehydrogenase family)
VIGTLGIGRPRRSRNARAVVTGAGSGIGRAFALELARRGGQVVCSDIEPGRAKDTADLIVADGGRALAVACDVADLDQVVALADEADCWFDQPISFLVNNAGVGVGGRPVGEIPIEDWRWALGVNLWGAVHGCHVFVPRLRQSGGGAVINVASAASFAAAPGMAPYSVSKAAVLSLSETVAAEVAGTGINVTALCPTFVKTNIARDGRIADQAGAGAERLMRRTGWSADRVVRSALAANDRGQLYVVPQPDAQVVWHAKRYLPATYTRAVGLAARMASSVRPTAGDAPAERSAS